MWSQSRTANYWKIVTIFTLWTIFTFISHFNAKSYIRTCSHSSIGFKRSIACAAVISAFQLCTISLLLVPANVNKAAILAFTFHSLGAFTTNASMAVSTAASTFAIKLTEPVIAAIMQALILKEELRLEYLYQLPLIAGGAMVFAGVSLFDGFAAAGAYFAFTSSIAFSLRNVCYKHLSRAADEKRSLQIRHISFAQFLISCAILVSGVSAVCLSDCGDTWRQLRNMGELLVSSCFHVIYSYISLSRVLEYMSVLAHSVCKILKRMAIIMAFYMIGTRVASKTNILGLLVTIAALVSFQLSKQKPATLRGKLQPETPGYQQNRITTQLRIAMLILTFAASSFATDIVVHGANGQFGGLCIREESNQSLMDHDRNGLKR